MKTVNETLGKIKGQDKIQDVIPGKGAFSKTGFADTVSALVNDTTFAVKTYNKDGSESGTMSISELIRSDLKKTVAKAGYPQKTEAGILDTCEIVTEGLSTAIPQIVMEQMKAGKKFDLPTQEKCSGSVFLSTVPGKQKIVKIRDPKTQENLGTAEITTQDSIQIRTKSPVPEHLQTKVRKDANGKIIG
jgi:hypothetical protein